MKSLSFSPVSIDSIGKALGGFFERAFDTKESYTRAATANLVFSGIKPDRLNFVLELVERLSVSHPSRFFLPLVDGSVERLEAFVSALCVPVSTSSAACSEVAKLLVPAASRAAMPSIIRAHVLPGLPNEVMCVGWDSSLEAMLPGTDTVYFDSSALDPVELLKIVDVVDKRSVQIVDFNWVRLGLWREEIKRIFDQPHAAALLDDLTSLVIYSSGYSKREYDVSAFTLAGWFASRMGAEVEAFGRSGWECAGRTGHRLSIRIERAPVDSHSSISKVEVYRRAVDDDETLLASLERGEGLESHVECGEPFSLTRQIEREDIGSVMERYFLVGESMVNYVQSARIGREMFELTRGFNI